MTFRRELALVALALGVFLSLAQPDGAVGPVASTAVDQVIR